MITRVYIDNFRCFTNFEAKPDHVNLLLGGNGAGKSTFAEVLHSVVALVAMGEAVDDEFWPGTLTRWDSRLTQRIEVDIQGNGGLYHYLIELLHDPAHQSVGINRETVTFEPTAGGFGLGAPKLFDYQNGVIQLFDDLGNIGVRFGFRGDRSFLPQIEPRPDNTRLTWLVEFLNTVWLVKLNPTDIASESEDEADSLDSDGSNFASWYRHISQERPQGLPRLFERLGETLPGFRSLRTVSTGKSGRKRELVADFSQSAGSSTYEVSFEELSDGERATIILYSLLMGAEGEPRTLVLDEPENFVGLQLIQPWLVELAEATRDKGQLFLISHNPEVIDYLAADHVLLFERPGGGPSRVRTNPFDRDQGLKASELVARGLVDAE